MLDGLEAVEITLSKLLVNNEEFRFDSEFFKIKYQLLDYYLKGSPKLDDLVYMSDLSTNGSFKTVADIIHDDNPKIVPFIRSGNTGEAFIKKDELIFISQEAHVKLPKSTTKLHDIIMARKGKIGGATIIMPDEVGFNCNENVIKLDINDKEKLNPFYFISFFNSKFGLQQIERLSTGNVQPWVSIFQIRKLVIPILNKQFQLKIENLVKLSHQKVEESKILYKQSEELLLKELDLLDFEPSKEKIAIKSFSESFGDSGRLDSEYYQPKYDDLINKFNKFNTIKLNELVNYPISSGTTPKAGGDDYTNKKEGIAFIRAVNVINSKVEFDNVLFVKDYIHNKKLKKTQLKENDVLFSIAGTVGRCGISYYKKEANINQAVAILRFNDDMIKRLYLILFFNSEIGKLYITKYARQGVQTNLNLNELGNIKIPILDYSIQTKIEEKIKESFKLKEESKELLEVAKRAVEIAIEDGEDLGMDFIKKEKI